MTATGAAEVADPSGQGLLRRGARVVAVALRGARGPFSVGIGGAVLYAAMTVAASLVLGWVTDDVLLVMIAAGEVDQHLLFVATLAIVGVSVFKAAGVVGRRLGAYIAQYTLQSTYRRAVTRRYLELPLAWHRRHPTGQLLSNANADVESAFFLAAPLPMAVGATVLVVVTGGLLVSTDPVLALVGFSIGPLLGYANWHYQRRMRTAATVAQQARAEVSETAHESFDAALVIKTLGREEAETRRFGDRSEDLRDKMIVVGRLRAFFDPVIEALPNVGILLVLLFGTVRVRDGLLTPGDLVLFAYLFRLLALPVRIFGWMLGEMPRAIVGWDRVERVLTARGGTEYGTRTLEHGPGGAHAVVDDVGFHHPAVVRDHLGGPPETADQPGPDSSRGLEGVDLDVAPGSIVAVVGATGSGKSTLAALLVRLFDPDRGRVALDGIDLRDLAREPLATHSAIVFQETFLFDDTVRGNITLGAEFPPAEVERAARLAQADGFVRALPLGYDTPVGERGATLSGGQRQRIALARALVRRPRLLVLDDATSAVDPSVEAAILHGLSTGDGDTTVVLVAHRTGAITLADEVVMIGRGRVVAHGTHEQLLRDVPAYRELVTAYARAGQP